MSRHYQKASKTAVNYVTKYTPTMQDQQRAVYKKHRAVKWTAKIMNRRKWNKWKQDGMENALEKHTN